MQPFIAMVIANLKMTVRNRQALFWNLAFPALFILIFGAVFSNDQIQRFDVGIAGAESRFRAAVTEVMDASEAFDVSERSVEEELDLLEDNERSIVLIFPEEGSDEPIELVTSNEGGPNAQIAMAATRSVVAEVAGQSAGVAIQQRQIESTSFDYIDWFVPGIIAFSLMNTGIIGISTAFVSFREKGILRRIKVTPFPLWKFLLARIVASLVMALATSGILIGIGWLAWDLTVLGNPLLIVGVIIVVSLTMLAIGYAVAAIARNTETAASYANLITFPMMFLSGVFFAVDAMPVWLQPLIGLMPLRYAVEALREPMLYGEGLAAITTELAILLAIFAAALLFALRFFRWDETPK
jgi:ABC-2 type transport system permease protein